MAEAVALSLTAKFAMALGRNSALAVISLSAVQSDIAAAKDELNLLRDHGSGDDRIDNWATQLHEVAFELEDIADECCYLSGHSFARYCASVPDWLALSKRLRKVREKLGRLSAAVAPRKRHHMRVDMEDTAGAGDERGDAIAASQRKAENARFMDKEEIIGFSSQMKLLATWLVDVEPRRTLVAVCGMGGVGKTTLVTSVYKEVIAARHFDCAAWVVVSQRFTRDKLLRKILKELGCQSSEDQPPMAALRGQLGGKRYLLVLDDVWDATLWDDLLQRAMPDDATGSRVVITTRQNGVAMAAAAPERTMALEPLASPDGWALFCSVVFNDVPGHKCPPAHLRELAGDLLERCHGLPLAIVSIGRLLRQKDRTEFAWRNTHDSLQSLGWAKNSDYLGIGEASSILNLSIDDLPYQLRRCFLSCSVYAEDFLIKRKILIRNWVAQGFIEEASAGEKTRTMEDVADHYLEELVHRNLFQVAARNEFGRAKRFLIHDLIKDLITHRSKPDGFAQFVQCEVTMNSIDGVRHLALDRCTADSRSVSAEKIGTLRSFHVFGLKPDAPVMSFFGVFRLLTVLNLWLAEIKKLPSSVTSLHNLRYLGIRSTLVEKIPNDLGNLQKLQTLDVKWSMVQSLPSSLEKLKSLRHLILFKRRSANLNAWPSPGKPVQLPQGLQNLTSLQTLKYIKADELMIKSLSKLQQMRSLELYDVDESFGVSLSSSISKMSHLRSLGINNHDAKAVIDLESVTRAPKKLQRLALTGRLATGKLPGWTCSLTSLKQVQLKECKIAQDSLSLISSLPGLLHLSLIAAYREKKMTFAAGSFPSLHTLALHELGNLSQIEFQRGCLAELQELVLDRCTRLTNLPQGMENLTRLQNLKPLGMATEFMEKVQDARGDVAYYSPANSMMHLTPLRYLRWIAGRAE